MGYIRKKLIVFTLLLFSTVALLTGCTKDKYKNLKLDVDKTDIEIVLSDNDEENVFSITSTVSKLPKGYDGAVSFTMPVNDFIEEVDVAPQVNNGVSTAYYKAKKQGGPVIITVKTTEGNLEKQVTVKVTKPITSLSFTQTTIPVVKGERTDISKFISFNPNGTTQNGIKLELTSGDQTNELIKVVTDGQYLTVPSDCTLTSFQVRARSTYNDQLVTEVANVKVVTIVDKENISLIYNNNTPNTTEDDVALTKNSKGEYNLVLATNAEDNYTKTIYFNFDNKVSENTNYTVTVKGLQDDGSIIDNNVVNSIVQVDKTLNAINSFDIKAIGNGSTQIEFVIERADFPGYEPFRQTIALNIKSEAFPTNITVTDGSNNQSLDEIKLYANYNESASIFGTRFRINVSNETGVMTNQNVILTLSSGGNFIQLYDRFKNAISFNTPISSDADYYMAHTYTTAPTAKITLTITSATFDKIVTTIPINIETDPLVLSTTQPELNIDINHKEIETPLSIDGVSVSAFDTLKVELVNEDGVDASKFLKYTQTNTSITLSPISDEIGECKVKVSAENGSEVVFTVILFESLNADTTTVKIAGQTLSAKTEVGGYSPTVVVKNGLNIPVSFTINGRNYTTLDNTGLRFSIDSSNTQIVKVPNYHSVETQNAPGTSMITVSITGFNDFGEQNKTLYFQISLTVSIPLTSLTTTDKEVTRYDTATLTANQRTQYGTYDIVLYSSPVNATIDYNSIDWTFTIDGVEYIYGQSPSVEKLIDTTNKIITYTFTYRSTCIVTLTTSMTNFRKATVECFIRESTIDILYFQVNAKVQQSFTNENGVTITSPKQASVKMIIKKAKSVSDYFFTNITEYTIAGTNDKYSEVVFDERDLEYDGENYTNYDNCLKVVPFTVYPSDALNKKLCASVNNASIEATVDNLNGVLNIRILSPFQDSNANVIVKVYPMDNPDTYKEIRVRVLNGKTEQTAFEIKNVEDLIKINTSLNAYYVLTSNIILDSWTPIGYNNGNVRAFNGNFSGTHNIYDANGNVLQSTSYSISGMTITDNELDYYGLFAFVGKNAVIHDLTLNDFLIRADINRSVNIYAGALAGYSEGAIRNVVINDGSGVANFNGSYYSTLEKGRTNSGIYITANTITTDRSYFFVGGLVGFANGLYSSNESNLKVKNYYDGNTNEKFVEQDYFYVDTTSIKNDEKYELYSNADIYNVSATTQLNVYVKSNNISYVGGLVGFNNKAYIANEDNEDDVTFGKDSANVITSINASLTDEQITNNINSAFGGVVGFNNGIVSNVIAKADIIGKSENENNEEYYMSNIGGVVGYNVGTIKGTTAYPLLRGYINVGGIVGKSESAIVHIDNTITLTTDGKEKTYSFINGIGLNSLISSEFLQADKVNFNKNFKIKLEKFSNESYDLDGLIQLFKDQYFTTSGDDIIEAKIRTLYGFGNNDPLPELYTIIRIDYVDLLSEDMTKDTITNYCVSTTYENDESIKSNHYYNSYFTTYTLAYKLAKNGINTVIDNDVQFLYLGETIKEYNTAIIGYNNVGGVIGQYIGLIGLGETTSNTNDVNLLRYKLVDYYYSSFDNSKKIASAFNYAIYNPVSYNTAYNYTGLKVVPINETGYTGGYYGNILLSDAHSQSASNSHRNYAGGLIGYMSNAAVYNSQVFADIQGRLAGLGGIVGKVDGITQINNVSYIGLIHNKETGATADATSATGGIVGDALSATTTFAYYSEYIRADGSDYTYIASPINVLQYEYNSFGKSVPTTNEFVSYNNISNAYFKANTLNSGYINSVDPFDRSQLVNNEKQDEKTKFDYYNNTSVGFVGEGRKEVKFIIKDDQNGNLTTMHFNPDGTVATSENGNYADGVTPYRLAMTDTLKVNFENLQNHTGNETGLYKLNENAYAIDDSESDAQTLITKFVEKTITYDASSVTNEIGLNNETNGITGPDDYKYQVPTSQQYWYINKQVNDGLPVLLSRQKAIYSTRTTIISGKESTEKIVNRVDLLANFPPTAINVDYTQNYVDTFIANINSDKTAVISYYELSQDSYDSTGTTIDFGNNNQYSQSTIKNYTNTLSSQLRQLNTFGYSEILNITTIPKFINANSVKVVSSNTSKLSIERDNEGKYKFVAKGAGVVELTVTSVYDPSKTKTIIVNIIYASQQLDLSYTNSGKTESIKGLSGKTIDLNKYSSTNPSNVSIKSNMKSTYNFTSGNGEVNKTFNLLSNYDGGIRYYILKPTTIGGETIPSIYWGSNGEDPTNSGITVNDQQLTTESVKYLDKDNNEQTNYVYYYDVPLSMDAKFKGTNTIQASFVGIPYVNVYDVNGNVYKKPLIELSSVDSTIEIDGYKLCGLSSINSKQLDFLKNIIHLFTINVKDINTGLVSSVNSININVDMEPTFDVEIETYKADEDLYITYQDGNYVERIKKIIEGTSIDIADMTLLCTAKDTSTQGVIRYTFSLYVSYDNKSNITSTYTKNLRFFVLKDGVEVTSNENGFVNAELHSIVDSKLNITIPVTINPQPINEIIIRHYPNSEITVTTDDNGKKITNVNLNEIAYDNIIPGHVGILKVYISPEYAYYDRVEIVSSVDANTVVQFEQMVANVIETEYGIYYTGNYETLVTDYVSINNGITLQKNSYINQNNQIIYNGYLYIRTLINSFVTDANSFTLTVRVYKNGSNTPLKTQSITLNVQAPPSLTMSIDGASRGVVARGTEQEFTVNTNDYTGVVDFSDSYLYRISNVSGSEVVLGRINSSFSVRYSNNRYYLVTDVNLEYGNYIKLIGKVSKSINGEVITSEAELTVKIVDYIIEEISVDNMSNGYITGLFNQPYALVLRISKAKYNTSLSALVNDKIRTLEKRYSQATHISAGSADYNRPYVWYSVDTTKTDASNGRYVSLNMGRNSSESYIIGTIDNYLDLDNISVYTVQNIKFGSGDTLAGWIKYVYDSTDIKPILDDSDQSAYKDDDYYYERECEFKFNFYRFRDEDHPDPIQNAEQLKNMEDGVDYILVNDITLTDWTPLRSDLKINSLDGNGYVIKIESFNLESYADDKELIDSVDIGIFSKINSGTTIKNLIIEVAPKYNNSNVELASYDGTNVDLYVDARAYKNVTFGLLAAENAGLVTNVQVVYNADSLKEERENITQQYKYTTNVTKNGSIRRDLSVIRIETTTTVESQTHYMAGLVARNLDEGESAVGSITNSSIDNISINGVGYVSGFVVENNGKISSSFYRGGNIINRIAENYNESATSGFAIYNTGKNAAIQYSYAQGRSGESGKGITYSEQSLNGEYDKTNLDDKIKNTFAGYNYANPKFAEGEQTIEPDNKIVALRAMNSMIDTKSNASAFIFENNAEVSNCYANILVNSVMSTSGFVFSNKSNGTISSCYTLSSVKLNDYSASPFTGRSDQSQYNNENPTGYSDTHYLKLGSDDNASTLEIRYKEEYLDSEEPATYLGASQFKEYNTFQSYAFNTDFEANTNEKVSRAVWFIPNASSQEKIKGFENYYKTGSTDKTKNDIKLKHNNYVVDRPELVAANLHTVSIRVWTSKDDKSNENSYVYASKPIGESIENPILIRTAEEFNNYLVYDSANSNNTNRKFALRFISDIAFNKTDLSAKTYTMDYSGDLDGNGMTIEHLRLLSDTDFETDENAENQKTVEYLGLFKQICTSYVTDNDNETKAQRGVVRNLKLVVDEVRGSKVTYVGVLAGSVKDGDVFNIDISGSSDSVYVQGRNVVGGLTGLVIGDSQIVNITSSINVQSTYFKYSNLFSSKNPNISTSKYGTFEIYDRTVSTDKDVKIEGDGVNNKTEISYVGGIVGIFDNDPEENAGEDNPLSLFNANARKLKVTGNAKLSGEIVGGVIGLVGYTSKVSDITFIVEENASPKIYATRVAGGLIGENRGKIERSYISHAKTLQDKIDAEYKNAVSRSTANIIAYSSASNYDTLFGRNAHYTGGVIGFNNKGTVENCYSRINVINIDSLYAGGFTGWDISGTYQYCYTTGSVSAYNSVGGFIGLLNRNSYTNGNLDWIAENFITNNSENSQNIGRGQKTLNSSEIFLTKFNGVDALNIWRKEDLNNDRTSSSLGSLNIGAYIGKVVASTSAMPKISDIFDYSTERTTLAKETNFFIQNDVVSSDNTSFVMTEFGTIQYGRNKILAYSRSGSNYLYKTMFKDDIRSTNNKSSNTIKVTDSSTSTTKEYNFPIKNNENDYAGVDSSYIDNINSDRVYGISGYAIEGYTEIINNHVQEKYKARLYSRMLNIGSARTLKEVINTLDVIDAEAKAFNTFNSDFVRVKENDKFNNNKNIDLVDSYSIYKIWSRTRWTGVEKSTSADIATVFPYLEAKPERTVIDVRTVEDLKLMNTYRTAEFVLRNDITFKDDEVWEPVGSMSQPFRGSLHSYKDGDNQYRYKINNLHISRSSMSTLYAGLVGYASSAQFNYFDLNRVNIDVSTSETADTSIKDGSLFVGSLIGYSDAGTVIDNVSIIQSKYVKAESPVGSEIVVNVNEINNIIKSNRAGTIGGLVGYNGAGTITNCDIDEMNIQINGLGDTSKANNDVNRTLAFGGLVGMMTSQSASIDMVSNVNVSGQIVINDCGFIAGSIDAQNDRSFDIGGLIGRVNDSASTTLAKITDFDVNTHIAFNLDFANSNGGIKYFNVGGVVGTANKGKLTSTTKNDGTINNEKKFTVNDQSKAVIQTQVNETSYINNYSGEFNYGGIVGNIVGSTDTVSENPELLNIAVKTTNESNKSLTFELNNCNLKSANIGGAVGYAENSSINNVYSNVSLKITNSTDIEDKKYNIGGLVGYSNNSQNMKYMYSEGTIESNLTKCESSNIGGAFGQVIMATNYEISNVVSQTKLTITYSSNAGSSNVGGFAGSIYNGSVNESVSTSDISIEKSSINGIKLNVGGFVGNIDITNDTIDKSYLDKTSYRSVKISNSYATNDIDLGNMFIDTTKHKAGLFIGSISTNDTDKTNRTININNNYTIGKFVYSTINASAYEERDNKGGFLGGFNTNIDTLSYISKLKNIVMFNNIYNRDFVSYTNEYGDAKSTKEMLFNSDTTFKGLEVNNSFKNTNPEIWIVVNNKYPQLKWINNLQIAGQSISSLQADGTKVAPEYPNPSSPLNGVKNKTYILNIANANISGNIENSTIYFNTDTKQTSLSSWSNVTLDYKSVVYGINTNVNSLSTMLVTTNNGLIVDTAIPNNLVGTNNGIIYQVTTIGTALSTASNNIVNTNNGIIDSVVVSDNNISGHIYNTSTGYIYRSVVKTTKSGGFNYANKGTIKDSYIRTGSTSDYKYVYYDGKGKKYEYVSSDSNKKDIIELVNVLDINSFDMVEDWTVIKGVNDGQPILQSELKGTDISSGKVNFYGDITDAYKWETNLSEADLKTLASRIGKSTATHINIIKGDRSGANSTDITLVELMKITTSGYIESVTQEKFDSSTDTNSGNAYYIDTVVNDELNTTDNLRILTIKEYNFGVITTTKKRIANIANRDFWLKDDIDLSGKLWTPIGVGYNNYILDKNETVNENSTYVNKISYPFNGTIAGNGNKITNMSVVGVNSNVGLFGSATSTSGVLSIFKDMLLTNSTVIGVADNGYAVAGAVAGRIIVPTLNSTNNSFDAYTKIGTQKANVYGSTRASGLIGDVLSFNSGFKALEMTYSYVNSNVITGNNGYASAFINMGNDYKNGVGGSYTNTSTNASVKEFYMAGNMYANGIVSDDTKFANSNTNSSLFGNFETNKDETTRSVYVIGYDDKYAKKKTSTDLKTKDLDYFTWGDIWTRISSNQTEEYNEGYPVLKNEVDYWILHTDDTLDLTNQRIEINSPEKLAKIADAVNTNNQLSNKTVVLTEDIDLSGKIWTPIGYNESKSFKGIFDFNGYSIKGLTVTGVYLKPTTTSSQKVETANNVEGVGLFGYLGDAPEIKSSNGVGKIGNDIELSANNYSTYSRITGISNVGALVGKADKTTINNVANYATVTSATTIGQANDNGVGGLIGTLIAKTSSSGNTSYSGLSNNGNIMTTRRNVGGVIGYLTSGSRDSVVDFIDIYNSGDITAEGESAVNIGGIIGYNNSCNININGFKENNHNYETLATNKGNISGYSIVGGIIGYSNKGIIQNIINAGNVKTLNSIAGSIAGKVENMEIYEVINTGSVNTDSNSRIGGIIGEASIVKISNILNRGSSSSSSLENGNYYGIVGRFANNDFVMYTVVDLSTNNENSLLYSYENVPYTARMVIDNNHILVNGAYFGNLAGFKTNITYNGTDYLTYLDVFNDNLLWDLTQSEYYLMFNTPVQGTRPNTTISNGTQMFTPTVQSDFNYLADLNRKRYGVSCVEYPILLSQNVTLTDHISLGRGAYPWKKTINGDGHSITVEKINDSSTSLSILGSVMGLSEEVRIYNLKVLYNTSITINKSTGLLLDTGYNIIVDDVTTGNTSTSDTINIYGSTIVFGTIANKLSYSTLSGACNNYKINVQSCNSDSYIGGLVGKAEKTIITRPTNKNNMTGDKGYMGAVVGFADGDGNSAQSVISDSNVVIDVDAKNSTFGGVAGKSSSYTYQTISDSNSTSYMFGNLDIDNGNMSIKKREGNITGASTIGGVIGLSTNDRLTEVSVSTNIIQKDSTTFYVGGIIGESVGSVLTKCNNASLIKGYKISGIVGKATNTTLTNCYNQEAGEIICFKGSTSQAAGFSVLFENSTMTDCSNLGYIAVETKLDDQSEIAGFVVELKGNSNITGCVQRGYIGMCDLAKSRANSNGYMINAYYSKYNLDDNNCSGYTYSYNDTVGTINKAAENYQTYKYSDYICRKDRSASYNISRNDDDARKVTIYDSYAIFTKGYIGGISFWETYEAVLTAYTSYGSPNSVGSFSLSNQNQDAYDRQTAFGTKMFGGFRNPGALKVSISYSYEEYQTSSFLANMGNERYRIYFVYTDLNGVEQTIESIKYRTGDSVYTPTYIKDTTNHKEVTDWRYAKGTSAKKFVSGTEIGSNTFDDYGGYTTITDSEGSPVKTAKLYGNWVTEKIRITLYEKFNPKREEIEDENGNTQDNYETLTPICSLTVDWGTVVTDATLRSYLTASSDLFDEDKYRIKCWYVMDTGTWNGYVETADISTATAIGDEKEQMEKIRTEARNVLNQYTNGNWENAKKVNDSWSNLTASCYTNTNLKVGDKLTMDSLYLCAVKVYTIKFMDDGNTIATKHVDQGSNLTDFPDDPTKEHYTFVGWFTSDNVQLKSDTKITSNMTVNAKYEPVKYNVKFVYGLNGEKSTTKQIEYNTSLLNSHKPSDSLTNVTGYTIKSWKDASGNEVPFNNTYRVTEDFTLTAYYEKIPYTVTFIKDGETYGSPVTVLYGDTVSEPTPPTSSNPLLGEFEYWCTDDTLTNRYDFSTPVKDNLTLYAKFKAAIADVTYKFVDSTGATISDKSDYITQVEVGSTLTCPSDTDPNFVINGYELEGFYTDTSFSEEYDFKSAVSTSQVVIYAQYFKTYTVTFVVGARYNGGESTSKTITVRTGNKIPTGSVPPVLTNVNKYGWLFVENDVASREIDFSTYAITSDINLYYYATNDVQIVYILEGDSNYTVFKTYSNVQYGETIARPDTDVAVDGYRFAGYYSDSTFNSEFNFDTDVITTKDTKIYAKMVKQITIEFIPYDDGSAGASGTPKKSVKIDKGSVVDEKDWITFLTEVDISDIVWYYTDSTHTEKTEIALADLQAKSFTENTDIFYKWNKSN